MLDTKVGDLMSRSLEFIGAEATLKEAAVKMEKIDCGVLPVGRQNGIEGIITDRDIVIRAIAKGKDPAYERVKDHMSADIYSCRESNTLAQAADEMREHNVGRLIVRNEAGDVTGVLSFGHILRNDKNTEEVANVVELAVGPKAA